MATTMPSYGFRRLNPCPWLQKFRSSSSAVALSSSPSPSSYSIEDLEKIQIQQSDDTNSVKSQSYYPKKNQTIELVCESLAYKGKGVCKVADTGFVVLCDRALLDERLIAHVTHKKGNYAEGVPGRVYRANMEGESGDDRVLRSLK